MKTKAVEQIEEIMKGITKEAEFTEIEKIVQEAKGKIIPEPTQGFWAGKRPCWEMCQCPEMIRNECPTTKFLSTPCWEIEGTYCKLDNYGATGDDTTICQVCRVYKRWGENKPIAIKLKGKGMNTSLKAVTEAAQLVGTGKSK